jgi:hypothetical protein
VSGEGFPLLTDLFFQVDAFVTFAVEKAQFHQTWKVAACVLQINTLIFAALLCCCWVSQETDSLWDDWFPYLREGSSGFERRVGPWNLSAW